NLETDWHRLCITLLIESVYHRLRHRNDYYVGGNMFIYYNKESALKKDFRGPDFFFVDGDVSLSPPRRYWVIWHEWKAPDAIIELSSPSTDKEDRTRKFGVYEREMKVRNYFIYDPVKGLLDGWELNRSGRYQKLKPNDAGWLWSSALKLWVGEWEGEYG